MFTPVEHEFVGTNRVFIPQGFSPIRPTPRATESLILPSGDTVTVLSGWTREYLPADAPTLLYVRSHTTGECTHVVAADLPLASDFANLYSEGCEWGHTFRPCPHDDIKADNL